MSIEVVLTALSWDTKLLSHCVIVDAKPRIPKWKPHQTGGVKDRLIVSILVVLLLILVVDALVIWLSAVGVRHVLWKERCSDISRLRTAVESMVENGDWKFDMDLAATPKEMRVELLASNRFLGQLNDKSSDAKYQMISLSKYRSCQVHRRKVNRKVNIRSQENGDLVAAFDGKYLHDCTELALWNQIVDGLIAGGYWAELEQEARKFPDDEAELLLKIRLNPEFHLNSKMARRFGPVKYDNYYALIARIGACTGYSSYFVVDGSTMNFGDNGDDRLEWVRANPSPNR